MLFAPSLNIIHLMTPLPSPSKDQNASHDPMGPTGLASDHAHNDLLLDPSWDKRRAYGRIAISLHWLLAALILYQLVLGWWMIDLPKAPVGLRAGWFNWHKSWGLVIGLLMCLRLIWRMLHPVQVDGLRLSLWQLMLSKLNHLALYLCILLMPLSGFLGSNFTPYPVKFFGWALPRFLEPSADLKAVCSSVHESTAYTLMVLVTLHLLGALWHAIKRDGILSRMGIHMHPRGEKNSQNEK